VAAKEQEPATVAAASAACAANTSINSNSGTNENSAAAAAATESATTTVTTSTGATMATSTATHCQGQPNDSFGPGAPNFMYQPYQPVPSTQQRRWLAVAQPVLERLLSPLALGPSSGNSTTKPNPLKVMSLPPNRTRTDPRNEVIIHSFQPNLNPNIPAEPFPLQPQLKAQRPPTSQYILYISQHLPIYITCVPHTIGA